MLCMMWLTAALAQPLPPGPPGPPPPPLEALDRDASIGADLAAVLQYRDALMSMLAKEDPRRHEHMLRLERRDPQAFALGLLRLAKKAQRRKSDPEAAERYRAIHEEMKQLEELAVGFGELSSKEQASRRADMEASARRVMELKQAERRSRVDELRAKIAELEADIEQREKDADSLVEAFVDQLLSRPVDL